MKLLLYDNSNPAFCFLIRLTIAEIFKTLCLEKIWKQIIFGTLNINHLRTIINTRNFPTNLLSFTWVKNSIHSCIFLALFPLNCIYRATVRQIKIKNTQNIPLIKITSLMKFGILTLWQLGALISLSVWSSRLHPTEHFKHCPCKDKAAPHM